MHPTRERIDDRTDDGNFSVWDTGRDAFGFLIGHKGCFFRLIAVPMGVYLSACFGVYYLWGVSGFDGRATTALYTLLAVVTIPFTVSWIRLTLMGEWAIGKRHGLGFGRREALFFVCYVAMAPLVGFSDALVETIGHVVVSSGLTTNPAEFLATTATVTFMTLIIALPIIARLALVLPSIAADEGANPLRAWRLCRNNGWRVLGVILLTGMLSGMILNFIGVFTAAIVLFTAGSETSLPAAIAVGAAMDGLMVFTMVASGASGLSLTYSRLTSSPDDTSPKPALRAGRFGRRQPAIH